jgi:hypothetical protein
MPKLNNCDQGLHSQIYLAMSVLYLLGCIGFDKIAVGAGLAICHYLLHRY